MLRLARQLAPAASAAILALASVFCLAGATWAHVTALLDNDPRLLWSGIWILEPLLAIVLVPIGFTVLRRGLKTDPFGLPRVAWRLLLALLVYYGAHFYWFLYRAQTVLRSANTWRMFSAGWILLFALASAVYLNYFRRHRSPPAG